MMKPFHLAGLNGLRAIAALAVVIFHIAGSLEEFGLDRHVFGTSATGGANVNLAGYGVTIFFALSGFLITSILIREKEQKGSVSIMNFYIRRSLRIWPLYYLYIILAIVAFISIKGYFDFSPIAYYLLFAANIPFMMDLQGLVFTMPLAGHYWSLGVEEQFYLFWPVMVQRIKKLLPAVIILGLVLVAAKIGARFYFGDRSLAYSFFNVNRFDCMMIGAAGGILYYKKHPLFMKVFNQVWTQALCWIVILMVSVNKFHIASVINHNVISIITVGLIIGQAEIKNRIINLSHPVPDFLGKISFGIYVIHPLIIFLLVQLGLPESAPLWMKYFMVFGLVTGLTIFFAHISFTWFESYFNRMKERFAVIKTKASEHDDEEPSEQNTKRVPVLKVV